jgi:hypothetical protein
VGSVGGREQVHELIVLDLAGAVLVDVLDELLNIDGHLELVFDDIDQTLSIDETAAVGFATHGHEGIQSVLFVASALELLLLGDNVAELGVGDLARVLGRRLGNHAVYLLLGGLLAHHLKDDTQLRGIDVSTVVLVEGRECFPALGFFFLGKSFSVSIVVLSLVFFTHC